jgi:molybdopterin-guanine dinucleotide biosynthesis protein MobB
MKIPAHWPVVGLCGFSGSGKTTLVERLVPRFRQDGLAVAVVKHDAHGLSLDLPGKDTDRFFQAGATVFAHDPAQGFLRVPPREPGMLPWALPLLLREHDLVIVEGHKQTSLPAKLWLQSRPGEDAPPGVGPVLASLGRDADRPSIAYHLIDTWLRRITRQAPWRAGILIGGRSTRMGHPKHLLELGGQTWLEREASVIRTHVDDLCLLGDGVVPPSLARLPRVPDVPGVAGPLAGMVAAMRWDPAACWLFAACDMPNLSADAIGWLLDQQAPGRWAAIPRHPRTGYLEPLCAWYTPRLATALEAADPPIILEDHPKVVTPEIPLALAGAWQGLNTRADLEQLS